MRHLTERVHARVGASRARDLHGMLARTPSIASASAPCTVARSACICQPANGVPSYSMVELVARHIMLNATRCPARPACRAGIPPPSSAACRRAALRRGAPRPRRTRSSGDRRAPCRARREPSPCVVRSTLTRSAAVASSNHAPGNGDSPRQWSCTSRHGLRPVDARLVLVDLGRIGDALLGLRRELQACRAPARRAHRAISVAPSRRQRVVQLAGRHVGADRRRARPSRPGRCRAPPPSASRTRRSRRRPP